MLRCTIYVMEWAWTGPLHAKSVLRFIVDKVLGLWSGILLLPNVFCPKYRVLSVLLEKQHKADRIKKKNKFLNLAHVLYSRRIWQKYLGLARNYMEAFSTDSQTFLTTGTTQPTWTQFELRCIPSDSQKWIPKFSHSTRNLSKPRSSTNISARFKKVMLTPQVAYRDFAVRCKSLSRQDSYIKWLTFWVPFTCRGLKLSKLSSSTRSSHWTHRIRY